MGNLVSSSIERGRTVARSARFGSQSVEQLVLFAFELFDRGLHLGSMAFVIPPGLAGIVFFSYFCSFDGVTGVFSASNITTTHILF